MFRKAIFGSYFLSGPHCKIPTAQRINQNSPFNLILDQFMNFLNLTCRLYLVSTICTYIHFYAHSPVILTHSGCHQRIIRSHSRYRQCSCGVASLLVNIQHSWCPVVFWEVPGMHGSWRWKGAAQCCSKQNRMSPFSRKVRLEKLWSEFR